MVTSATTRSDSRIHPYPDHESASAKHPVLGLNLLIISQVFGQHLPMKLKHFNNLLIIRSQLSSSPDGSTKVKF